MSSMFGGRQQSVMMPVIPQPTPAPPPPDRSDAEIAAAAKSQRDKFFGAQGGRAATMLTGGSGTETPSRTTRFLGGGM